MGQNQVITIVFWIEHNKQIHNRQQFWFELAKWQSSDDDKQVQEMGFWTLNVYELVNMFTHMFQNYLYTYM